MRGKTNVIAAVFAALALFAGIAPADAKEPDTPETAPDVEDLELVEEVELTPRLSELTFTTPALEHPTKVRVLVPDDYDPTGSTHYPVLYLLHGGGDSYRSWVDKGDATAATAGLDLIVVMPDNNEHGNYVDWYNAGAGGPPMWETYIIDQLVPFVDAHYPTVGTRDGRAVAGLSMGGGGAMAYATRHPDLFTAAAAFSGAVDTNTLPVQALVTTSGVFDQGATIGAVHGLRLTNEVRWRGHNPWDLAVNLTDVDMLLHLRTGNGLPGGPGGDIGDPIEFFIHEQMTNLHKRLAGLDIDHVWDDYGAGGHTWFYWQRDLRQLLPGLMDRFAHPVPPPEHVTFKATEADYSVFGWDVSIDRHHPEFSRLSRAGVDGFELRGSGSATVITPGNYQPGRPIDVEIVDRAGHRTETLRADASGRLRVDVDLGRANPYKQFTVQGRLWALLRPGGASWPARTATVTIEAVPESPPRMETFDFPSELIDTSTPGGTLSNGRTVPQVNVLLPAGYDSNPSADYPVLWLLHGANLGTDFWAGSSFAALAGEFPGIIVMPDGGVFGMYTDWWNGGERGDPAWATYHLSELMDHIESTYRIRPGRDWHSLLGISMGGQGALRYATMRPGYFGSVAAFSAAMPDIQSPLFRVGLNVILAAGGGPGGIDYPMIWGSPTGEYAEGNSPKAVIGNLEHTRVFLSSGNGVHCPQDPTPPLEELLLGAVTEAFIGVEQILFHLSLELDDVDVTAQSTCGIHAPGVWNRAWAQSSQWGYFGHAPAEVDSWTYRTIAPSGTMWGIDFDFAAPPRSIVRFDRDGTTLSGSGSGQVTLVNEAGCHRSETLPFEVSMGDGWTCDAARGQRAA